MLTQFACAAGMTTSRKKNIEAFIADLRLLRRAMTFRMPQSTHTPRITPAQWGALMFLEEQKESTVKDMARALGITSSAATQLVDGLVANGYVSKKQRAEDRRVVALSLSKKTATQVAKMKEQGIRRLLALFDVLDDAEFDRYLKLTNKIVSGCAH